LAVLGLLIPSETKGQINREPPKGALMAIYHMSVKTISRSNGRSATASAAYRSAEKIKDQITGKVFDYAKKQGVLHSELVLPKDSPNWNRSELWNAAEQSETRKNSTVAREFVIALPSELSEDQRKELAKDLTKELVKRHGFAADLCIHEPNKEGDDRNHHAHILCSTRKLEPTGFTAKTRELDGGYKEVEYWRERFAEIQNKHLEKAGLDVRVDHRTLKEQGIQREPQKHKGASVVGMERRTGEPSRIGVKFEMQSMAKTGRERLQKQLEEMRQIEKLRQEQQRHAEMALRKERSRGLSR